jgi:hypothetical protein
VFTSRSSLLIIVLILAGTVLVLYYRAGTRPPAAGSSGPALRSTPFQEAQLLAVDHPDAPFPVVTVEMRSGEVFEGQVVVRGPVGSEVDFTIVNPQGQRLLLGKAAPRWTFAFSAPTDARYQLHVLGGEAPQGALIRYRVRLRGARG